MQTTSGEAFGDQSQQWNWWIRADKFLLRLCCKVLWYQPVLRCSLCALVFNNYVGMSSVCSLALIYINIFYQVHCVWCWKLMGSCMIVLGLFNCIFRILYGLRFILCSVCFRMIGLNQFLPLPNMKFCSYSEVSASFSNNLDIAWVKRSWIVVVILLYVIVKYSLPPSLLGSQDIENVI